MIQSLLRLFAIFNLILTVFSIPTWPSSFDELEDIKYLHTGYLSRGFAFAVTPCSFTRSPGRSVAAGFLRTAFHDMAPANVAAGTGGVDASIGFELQGEYAASNVGPGFNNTITYYSRFFNSQASVSDLIALGVYTAVRSCGGPVVETRSGRVDATQAGALGVPDVRDSGATLGGHFQRMGLTREESIQIVTCGHTLGGVHSTEFPAIVPSNTTTLGTADFDSTNSTYDNRIVTEYISGTTKNPLVVGADPSARSDLRLFSSDGNATISKLQDPNVYQDTCARVLQKMIDTVPRGVVLTDAITAYPVKPYDLQLNVIDSGDKLSFTGQIRIRTNDLAKTDINKVELEYKTRDGSDGGVITAQATGDANGFDDTFTFYGFNANISAQTAISSFDVLVTLNSGDTKTFDNNGKSFPVSDAIFAQTFNSALTAPTGTGVQKLNIVAAVRNGQSPSDLTLTVTTINPQTYNTLPTYTKTNLELQKACEGKYYTFYAASADVFTNKVNSTKYDVSFKATDGSIQADKFNSIKSLPPSPAPLVCGGGEGGGSLTTITGSITTLTGSASTSASVTGSGSGILTTITGQMTSIISGTTTSVVPGSGTNSGSLITITGAISTITGPVTLTSIVAPVSPASSSSPDDNDVDFIDISPADAGAGAGASTTVVNNVAPVQSVTVARPSGAVATFTGGAAERLRPCLGAGAVLVALVAQVVL